jgi:hypothetical protein
VDIRREKGDNMDVEEIERVVAEEAGGAGGEGRLACARARGIAGRLGVAPEEVGNAADRLKIRIVDCQLGCFGTKKATHEDLDSVQVSEVLAEAITASLVDGYLFCTAAFEVARKVKATPEQVGDAATKMQVRISKCQLGCFP